MNLNQVTACAACCIILPILSSIYLVTFTIALALWITLDVFQLNSLTQMTSQLVISILHVHFDKVLVLLAHWAYIIVSSMVNNLSVVWTTLNTLQLLLAAQMTFLWWISTWWVCFINVDFFLGNKQRTLTRMLFRQLLFPPQIEH